MRAWSTTLVGRFFGGLCLLSIITGVDPIYPASEGAAQDLRFTGDIEEIVVTARKREEALTAVPQAISVLSGDDLRRFGVKTSPELAQQTPNLMWHSALGFASPNIFLRGIGNTTFNANQANPVGIYVDGAYQGSNITYGFGLFDLERVEILKGPQGTLFGRNTTAGVINFVSRKPDPSDDFNGEATVSYGRFDEVNIEAAAGFTVNDNTAVRLSALVLNRDGYVKNSNATSGFSNQGDVDIWSARAQGRFIGRSGLDVLLNVHGGQNQSDVIPGKQLGVVCPAGVDVPRIGACSDFFGFTDSTDLRESFTNIQSVDQVDTWGASATASWPLSEFTIVSQTAYEANDRRFVNDSDAGPFSAVKTNVLSDFYQFSQELRVESTTDGALSWLGGGNLYIDKLDAFQNFALNAFGPGGLSNFFPVEEGMASVLKQESESFALFGEANYKITSELTLTAGVRWTRDKRTAQTQAYIFEATGLGTQFITRATTDARLLVQTIPEVTVSRAWSEWSGRGTLSYQISDNWLVFGGVSRGFKGGDFNGGALFDPVEANLVNPEFVTSYEIGARGQTRDQRISLDLSAFHYDFTDQQVAILVPGSNATLQTLSNAAKTRVLGFEAEARVFPIENLSIELKVGVLDAEFKRFQLDADDPSTDFAGNRTASAPSFSFVGAGRYNIPLQIGRVGVDTDVSYTSSHFFTADNNPALREDGYWLLNGSLYFEDKQDRYKVSLWMKNVAGEKYFVSGLSNSGLGFLELFPGMPRTFGVSVTGKF